MKIIFNKKALFFISFLTCSTSYAASFECNKAGSPIENMICSDHKLNRLDDFLAHNYKIAINSEMPDTAKQDLKNSQIEWLDKRNDCSDEECLKNIYAKRIDYLWDKCFEYVRGRINYVKYSEAIDVINQEERADLSSNVVNDSFKKNESQLESLGFKKEQLSSNVYIDVGNHVKFYTLGEYLTLMYELPGFKSMDKIDYNGYVGFRIKISGEPYTGFVLREDSGDLFLVGLISGDEVLEAVSLRETRALSSIYMNYANVVINNRSGRK
ncbi:lysozyme inhibitor LprI family protein [Pectobacterium carotovorum]|uniref:lysozyme inhibitor LprI family protein n=1 Tax=Pectobacterium carotovorum TaxID=554 RepID=UPI001EFC0345|nr:lysozyme inhibitor LprI family protein [Pectobacterium carotovorum]ULS49476.1 DUF1311 domain-containing protein [Pectobacterium carotovorum]